MNDSLSHVTVAQVLVGVVAVVAAWRGIARVWPGLVRAVHFMDKLESIEKQLLNNGGTSMRDAVDRLEVGQAETNHRVEQVATTQAALAAAHSGLADEVAQLRHALERAGGDQGESKEDAA